MVEQWPFKPLVQGSSPCTLTIRQIPARGFFVGSGSPLGMLFEPLHAHNQTDPREGIFCWFGVPVGDAIRAPARSQSDRSPRGDFLLVQGPRWGMLFKPVHAHNQTDPREGIFCWFRIPVGGCCSSLCTPQTQTSARGFFVGSGSPLGDAIQAPARSQSDRSPRGDFLLARGPRWGKLFEPVHAHNQTDPREGIFCWFRVPVGGCY